MSRVAKYPIELPKGIEVSITAADITVKGPLGTLKQFKAEFPQRFFMEGVSEAHIVTMAAALAMEGKVVYINTIATFLTLFVVPIVYILMDRLCVKLTGHSSAHGLIKAEEIERETAAAAGSIAH